MFRFGDGRQVQSMAKLSQTAQVGATVISAVLGLLIAGLTQASSPNYRELFYGILPFFVLNAALITFVYTSKDKGLILSATIPGVLALLAYFEMGCRVLAGIRLL